MVVSTAATVDVSQALAGVLADIDGLRVYWYVADKARPDCCIVSLPNIDYVDRQGGFCFATWTYTLAIVVARNTDQAAQEALSRLVNQVALALNTADPDGIFSITPISADPTTATIGEQTLPAYSMRVAVRA